MKITGGQWKGRNLKVPHRIRPTTSRSKEVLFALIDHWLPEAVVIDLFCGSGVLGLECLSRGANHVFFIDRSNRCIQVVRDNIESIGVGDSCTVIQGDGFRMLKKLSSHGQRADVILADPPYESELSLLTVSVVAETGILAPEGILIVEFRKGEILKTPPGMTLLKSKMMGDTGLMIWQSPLSSRTCLSSNI
jgi:16S rRNA (guanine966-N2)-methyltransferase